MMISVTNADVLFDADLAVIPFMSEPFVRVPIL